MSLSGAWYEKFQEETNEYNRILKEKGKKAADEFSRKSYNKSIKGLGYSTSGSFIGAVAGSCIPFVGTIIGGTIGGYIGMMMSIDDD